MKLTSDLFPLNSLLTTQGNSVIWSKTLGNLPVAVRNDFAKAKSILLHNGATKIILYGSMARGDFRADSDIDLCVEGLPGSSYFRAVGECLMNIESHVSIVPFQNTWGYFRQRILQEGKIIYEQ